LPPEANSNFPDPQVATLSCKIKVPMLSFLPLLVLLASATPGRTEAATDADFITMREQMVEEQLRPPGRDISDSRVLAAMRSVPRHLLVPEEVRAKAYADSALPIGHGQTISQPFVVAFMTEQLNPQPGDRVLEIGTGSGYQAAILAELVDQVYTIEIVPELAARATHDLAQLGYENVQVRLGDGYLGWPEAAPFDAIIVTCAPEAIPGPLVEQLKEGGRMIIPVGGERQELHLLTKREGEVQADAVLPVRFVPMTGQAQESRAQE
jgi:protein-L-isoaspartate(D-aspartate) O-methyltransferase